jgi:hypothetical protein
MSELLLDAAGRRRSPATLPEFHAGRPPRNKGMRYPADPRRLRGLIVVLWSTLRAARDPGFLAGDLDEDRRRGSRRLPAAGRGVAAVIAKQAKAAVRHAAISARSSFSIPEHMPGRLLCASGGESVGMRRQSARN